MRVKPLLSKINPDTFIEDYLQAHGVDNVNLYLEPDKSCLDRPEDYPNMAEGEMLLNKAIHNDWRIGLLVDVDCDGCCSATLIRQFLNSFDIDPTIYIRKGKAHGLRKSATEDVVPVIIDDGIQLLIVPDAGSNDTPECKELLSNGCQVLVLDHHKIGVDNPYAVVINHHLLDKWRGLETGQVYHNIQGVVEPCENLNPLNVALSGTGVTAKFVEYCCTVWAMKPPCMDDLIALSTISDSCDLTALENRYYVYKGLGLSDNAMLNALFPGMVKRYGYTPKGYSWAIAPLINAVCREEETEDKYKLFDAFSGHGDVEAALKMCRATHRVQTERVKQAVEEIEPTLDLGHKVIVGFADVGLANQIGLIANKFQSKYNKPTILLRQANATLWSGSLRSPVDLTDIINESGLGKAMGHSQAAGVLVKKANLQHLIDYLDKADFPLEPEIDVAGCIAPKQINNKLCKACENSAELWGQGLREPTFYINTEIEETNVQVFEKRTTTVKITVNGADFLLFMATTEQVDKLTQKGKKSLSLIVTLSTNEWNGVVKPQGKIKQFEVSKVEDKDESWEDDF